MFTMLNFRWVALGALAACGSDPGTLSTGRGDAGTEVANAALCKPGSSQACYCPDGARSGTQQCSRTGELGACACDDEAPAKPRETGGALCPELGAASACSATAYESHELPTSMLFVLDRSRSMVCNLPPLQSSTECEQDPQPVDEGAPSKWQVTRAAFSKTFDELPLTGSLVGLSFFANDGECGVDSTPNVELAALDRGQKQKLTRALNDMTPDGQTPIVGATILAYAHLHQELKAPGNRYVVLMTDGAESCAPDGIDQLLTKEVQRARDANIRTFVIGAPGSEQARAVLSELAYRGGTARSSDCVHDRNGASDKGDCHLDMTTSTDFAAALAGALGKVSSAAQSCEFPVEKSDDPENVNVQYTPSAGGGSECFARDDKPCAQGANGWQFGRAADGKEDFSRVVLCGDACERIRQDPAARVDILVGCESITFI